MVDDSNWLWGRTSSNGINSRLSDGTSFVEASNDSLELLLPDNLMVPFYETNSLQADVSWPSEFNFFNFSDIFNTPNSLPRAFLDYNFGAMDLRAVFVDHSRPNRMVVQRVLGNTDPYGFHKLGQLTFDSFKDGLGKSNQYPVKDKSLPFFYYHKKVYKPRTFKVSSIANLRKFCERLGINIQERLPPGQAVVDGIRSQLSTILEVIDGAKGTNKDGDSEIEIFDFTGSTSSGHPREQRRYHFNYLQNPRAVFAHIPLFLLQYEDWELNSSLHQILLLWYAARDGYLPALRPLLLEHHEQNPMIRLYSQIRQLQPKSSNQDQATRWLNLAVLLDWMGQQRNQHIHVATGEPQDGYRVLGRVEGGADLDVHQAKEKKEEEERNPPTTLGEKTDSFNDSLREGDSEVIIGQELETSHHSQILLRM